MKHHDDGGDDDDDGFVFIFFFHIFILFFKYQSVFCDMLRLTLQSCSDNLRPHIVDLAVRDGHLEGDVVLALVAQVVDCPDNSVSWRPNTRRHHRFTDLCCLYSRSGC